MPLRRVLPVLTAVLVLTGCGLFKSRDYNPDGPGAETQTLTEARKGFETKLARKERSGKPVDTPPARTFQVVKYESPAGKLSAYMTPDPRDKKRRPAMIWITGGDCNTIEKGCWEEGSAGNDQSASPFRKAGLVMMFPSLRGGNDNPGYREGFFGEVDDILAAAEFLAKQDHVDPKRIYLGGHSTGGTMVLLVAASAGDRFRAVFSFGPVHDMSAYDDEFTPFDKSNPRESELRSPVRWLHSIQCPTFVLEGSSKGNAAALNALSKANRNSLCHFYLVKGPDHFSILKRANTLLAERVVKDDGPTCNIALDENELNRLFGG
ncbi:MAG TPA: alpha/beta fold hydrolase [Gemmataceae bacterium]|nr:alpha/beta fold hydrolase [Gemmataceae bacterium]